MFDLDSNDKPSAIKPLLVLFISAFLLSAAIYFVTGWWIDRVTNSYIDHPVPLADIERHFAERDAIVRPLDMLRGLSPALIFPIFGIFAIKPITRLTGSTILRGFLILFFFTFPEIVLFLF